MRPIYLWGLLLILGLFQDVFSQKPADLAAKGSEANTQKDFFSAAQYFAEALNKDSSVTAWWFGYAEASRLSNNYSEAERAYKKVSEKDNGKDFPEALFFLAETKKIQGKYKEALKLFEKSQRRFQKKLPSLATASGKGIEDCNFAQSALKNPAIIKIQRAQKFINSPGSDLAPLKKNGTLYYSSTNPESGKNQIRRWNESAGNNSEFLSADTAFHISSLTFGSDESLILCSICKDEAHSLKCKITTCSIENSVIKLEKSALEGIKKTEKNQTHPALGNIGENEYLFFSSDREGGFGGMDIWFTTRKKESKWCDPINAGKAINTEKDEISPFICSLCQVLFFSSNGRVGMGGFDVYRTNILGNEFSVPENLGPPFNTGYHEVNFSLSEDRKQVWFSSNRPDDNKKDETCCNDIFYADLPQPLLADSSMTSSDSVKILGAKISTLIPLSLYFNNDEPDKKTLNSTTNKNYRQTCANYLKEKDNYIKAFSKGLNHEKREKALIDMEDFFEDSVRAGMQALEKFTLIMNSILEKGGQVEITMKGYCSPLASNDYNINLAKRRIASLKNYFNEWGQGRLKEHYDKGTLIIKEEQVGEIKADKIVSDNPNDQVNSVYSLSAALERKIEIIAISTYR